MFFSYREINFLEVLQRNTEGSANTKEKSVGIEAAHDDVPAVERAHTAVITWTATTKNL